MRRRHFLTQTGLWTASATLFPPVTARIAAAAAAPIPSSQTPDGEEDGPQKTPFQQLFPQPTGENGYEEIVLAGMAARDAERRTGFTFGKEAALTQRRQFLNERDVRRALSLLRQGLAKPIVSPHLNADFNTLMPDMSLVRLLARVLMVEQYVHLADGRTAAAIDSMADGLRLARIVSGTFLIGGLVGAASEALVLTPIATYRDQFCVRDCTRLILLARQLLAAPDPLLNALEMERKSCIHAISTTLQGDVDPAELGLFSPDDDGNLDAHTEARVREIQALRENPSAVTALMEQITGRINAAIDRQIAWHKDPAAIVPEKETQPETGLTDFLVNAITPVYGNVSRRFAETRIRLQLVGVHAAIRRYRWEYERLPDSLDELRLKGLEIDPYTRQPFAYRRTGNDAGYVLASAGPFQQDDQGNPVPGQRESIVFPRPPAPAK